MTTSGATNGPVVLHVAAGDGLGMVLDYVGDALRIADIRDGAVAKSNRRYGTDLRVGEFIVCVDGVSGNDEVLMKRLQKRSHVIRLGIQRVPIDRDRIDFTNPESLIAHALWQEEALHLKPLLPIGPEQDCVQVVERRGVARVPGSVSRSTAESLSDFVRTSLRESVSSDIQNLRVDNFSSGIFSQHASPAAPQTRWELRLPMAPCVSTALNEIFSGALGPVLAALAGPDAELWELSAIISAPGAAPQIVHADTAYASCPSLITTFVALQDVSTAMGPTCFVPGTHNDKAAHMRFMEDPLEVLSDADGRACVLDIGDAAVYDSRILHRGGTNRSDRLRALLCITFRHQDAPAREEWSSNSISADVAGRYTMRSFARAC